MSEAKSEVIFRLSPMGTIITELLKDAQKGRCSDPKPVAGQDEIQSGQVKDLIDSKSSSPRRGDSDPTYPEAKSRCSVCPAIERSLRIRKQRIQ